MGLGSVWTHVVQRYVNGRRSHLLGLHHTSRHETTCTRHQKSIAFVLRTSAIRSSHGRQRPSPVRRSVSTEFRNAKADRRSRASAKRLPRVRFATMFAHGHTPTGSARTSNAAAQRRRKDGADTSTHDTGRAHRRMPAHSRTPLSTRALGTTSIPDTTHEKCPRQHEGRAAKRTRAQRADTSALREQPAPVRARKTGRAMSAWRPGLRERSLRFPPLCAP